MVWNNDASTLRDFAAIIGMLLIVSALWGYDWRLGVAGIGTFLLICSIVGMLKDAGEVSRN